MSKTTIYHCKHCKAQTKHSESMTGECIRCGFSNDDANLDDEELDLEWNDETHHDRRQESHKTHSIRG